jgi:hypothetical protein
MFAFAVITTADPTSKAAAKSVAAFICIFTFTYSATWGTVVPVVVGEIPSNRLRSKSLGFSVSFTWAGAILVICGAPYLIQPQYANLGTKVGFIFGGLTVPLLLFAIFFVPETKGRTLEEIDEMFLNVSIWHHPMVSLKHADVLGSASRHIGSRTTFAQVRWGIFRRTQSISLWSKRASLLMWK